jgi:hypothetical protein
LPLPFIVLPTAKQFIVIARQANRNTFFIFKIFGVWIIFYLLRITF